MSHPQWEVVHHINNSCHFESGRFTSQKKHITGFEVLQATGAMCVLRGHDVFSFACLFVKSKHSMEFKGRFTKRSSFSLSQIPYWHLVLTSVKIPCNSNASVYHKRSVRRIRGRGLHLEPEKEKRSHWGQLLASSVILQSPFINSSRSFLPAITVVIFHPGVRDGTDSVTRPTIIGQK